MATGDQDDILSRLKRVLPNGWFGSVTPILDGLLSGAANSLAFCYALLAYARLQTRLATATDFFLDLAAKDFFGLRVQRMANEADPDFSARIRKEILRPRQTRASVVQVLEDLGCPEPFIFEPTRPADTGGYNVGGVGYNVAGGYGSLLYPFQAFITAFRPAESGIPNVGGYYSIATNAGFGGYGIGSLQYGNLSMIIGAVTDAQIFAAIDSVRPVGTILWTQLEGAGNRHPLTPLNLTAHTKFTATARGSIGSPGTTFLTGRVKVAVRNRQQSLGLTALFGRVKATIRNRP